MCLSYPMLLHAVRAYASVEGVHATLAPTVRRLDTGFGMAFEIVTFDEAEAAVADTNTTWINYAERDAFRDVAGESVRVCYLCAARVVRNGGWLRSYWPTAVLSRHDIICCTEAHYMLPPANLVRVHIPWTENDYQASN